MRFDAVFLASPGRKQMFFLPGLCGYSIVGVIFEKSAHFAAFAPFLDDGADDDHGKEQHNDAGGHRKGDRDADDKDNGTKKPAADHRRHSAKQGDGENGGDDDGGKLVHNRSGGA